MDVSAASAYFVFALGLWGAWGWHQDNDRRTSRGLEQSTQAEERSASFVPVNGSAWAPRGPKIVVTTTDSCYEAMQLIPRIAAEYDAPAGMLYGIWKKESSGLCGGYRSTTPWKSPPALLSSGECAANYKSDGVQKCARNYAALKAVCAQTRMTANGPMQICDLNEIKTSWAFAMGPMQVMPTTLFRLRDGRYERTDHAVDYDGDGVVDPHSLPDALASAAKLIKHKYANAARVRSERNPFLLWEDAANLYYGALEGAYYSGQAGKRGVRSYWTEWCEITGACNTNRVAYAAR